MKKYQLAVLDELTKCRALENSDWSSGPRNRADIVYFRTSIAFADAVI